MSGVRDVDGIRRRVEMLIGLDRAEEAADLVRQALGERPYEPDLWCALGHAEIARNRPREALEAANEALSLNPEEEWPHRIASLSLTQLGQHPEAIRAAHECVRLAPYAWQAHDRLACALAKVPAERPNAWAAAQRAVELAPHEPETHFTVGNLALDARDHAQAEEAFRRVLQVDPAHAGALNNLALIDLRRGRYSQAALRFGATLAMSPGDDFVRLNLHATLWNALRKLHLVLFGSLWVVWLAFRAAAHSWWASGLARLMFGVVAAAAGSVAWVWVRRLPVQLRPYLRRLFRHDAWLVVTAATLAVAVVLLVGAALLPYGWQWCLGGAIIAVLFANVGGVVGRNRHNARLKRATSPEVTIDD
jgi:tetratricopeptide (TPR) repeat protein